MEVGLDGRRGHVRLAQGSLPGGRTAVGLAESHDLLEWRILSCICRRSPWPSFNLLPLPYRYPCLVVFYPAVSLQQRMIETISSAITPQQLQRRLATLIGGQDAEEPESEVVRRAQRVSA